MSLAVGMRSITKSFGSVQALSEVDFEVQKGSIHALVGENGAGKTTLMRILYGADRSDSGEIELWGRPCRLESSRDAIQAGVGMVSQHYSIIPELTCLENLILGAEPGPLLKRADMSAKADDLASQMGFRFDWGARASDLSPGGAQQLEILKLLWRKASLMILDEPTAMLSPAESDALFVALRRFAAVGTTVIVVTHRLPEVFANCERVTVLRGGRKIADAETSAISPEGLAELMVGHAISEPGARSTAPQGEVKLSLQDAWAIGDRGNQALRGASLSIRAGEVLGVAGIDGNGQRELVGVLVGEIALERGTLTWDGEPLAPSGVSDRLRRGFRLIPEDRHAQGVVGEWSLEENAALGGQRMPPFARNRVIDLDGRRNAAAAVAEKLETKYAGLGAKIDSLSGGNQQRFVIGRALFGGPEFLIGFQPARGLDFDATHRFYAAVRNECERGCSALVVSLDLDELLEYCDRIVVMRDGVLAAPPPGSERDRSAIGRLMVGAA